MSIGVVQTVSASAATQTVTVTLAATGAGNCLVVCCGTAWTNTPVSAVKLGGSAGNFAVATEAYANYTGGDIWVDDNCAGGQTSLAVTFGASGDDYAVVVYEISGLATSGAVDQVAAATGSGTAVSSGATATTTAASEIWIGLGSARSASSITGPSSPWTNTALLNYQYSGQSFVAGYQIVSSEGAATYASTAGSTFWAGAVVTLQAASAGGSVTGTGGLALAPLAVAGTGAEKFTGTGGLTLASLALAATDAETFTGTANLALAPLGLAGTGAEGAFAGTYRLYPSTNGKSSSTNDQSAYTFGLSFKVTSAGYELLGWYWWVADSSQNTASQNFALWTSGGGGWGTYVAGSVTASGALSLGWNWIPLATPIALTQNQEYRAVCTVSGGPSNSYSGTNNYFGTGAGASGVTNGPLFAYAGAGGTGGDVEPLDAAQMSFNAGATNATTQYPASSYEASNYWMDVLVGPTSGAVTGTGGLALAPLALAATDAEVFTGTGSLHLAPLGLAGTGAEGFSGTGGLGLAPLGLAATDAEVFTAAGGLTLAPLGLAGTGTVIAAAVTGTGGLALAPLGLAATDAETFTSTAGLALAPLGLAGTGTAIAAAVTGTGSLPLAPLAVAGTAAEVFAGTGGLALAPLAVAGTGAETGAAVTGTGSVSLAPLAVAATAAEVFTATAGLTLAPLAAAGTGAEAFPGTGGLALAPLAVAGTAAVPVAATGGLALAPLAVAAAAAETFAGAGGLGLAPPGLAVSGETFTGFTGTGGLALAPLRMAGPPPRQGSWWALDSVLKEQAAYVDYYRSVPPVACPWCGQPLTNGPPQAEAVLFCPNDGWQYPRDYDVESMAGM